MSRPRKRDQGRAAACLLIAGVRVALEHAGTSTSRVGDASDFPIEPVLDQAAAEWRAQTGEPRGRFSRSSISRNYGSVDAFRAAVLSAIQTQDLPGTTDIGISAFHELFPPASHLDDYARRVDDPLVADARATHADFAAHDLLAMTERNPVRTRLWWGTHASAARSATARQVIEATYAGYDELLAPLLRKELHRRGRRLRDGVSIRDLLVSLTIITEGAALRVLGDPAIAKDSDLGRALALGSATERPLLVETLAEVVIEAMTEPDGD